MIKKNDKRGIAPLILIVLIIGGIILFGGGLISMNFNSIPAPVWIGLTIFLAFFMFRKKK